MIAVALAALAGALAGAAIVLAIQGRRLPARALGAVAGLLAALGLGRAWGRREVDPREHMPGPGEPPGLAEPTDPRLPPRIILPTDHTRPEDRHDPPPPPHPVADDDDLSDTVEWLRERAGDVPPHE